MKKLICLIVFLSFVVSGCATTGPKVSSREIRDAEDSLRLKAMTFQYQQLEKMASIGYNICKNLPEKDRKGKFSFIGAYFSPINKDLMRLYNLQQKKGIVIIAIVKGGPADRAGLKAGNVISEINGKPVKSISDLGLKLKKIKPSETVQFKIIEDGTEIVKDMQTDCIPVNVAFEMDPSESVNAGALPHKVMVTYGLTRFAKSDDEIAVVLAHELAHITKGHMEKSAAGQAVSTIAAIGLGITAEVFLPGTGSAVMRGVGGVGDAFGRVYSQDLEREADYFGIQYVYNSGYNIDAGTQVWERFAIEVPSSMVRAYLSTHPSSPERYVRIKKAIEEIKAQNAPKEEIPVVTVTQ